MVFNNSWQPWRYPGYFICDCGEFLGEWPGVYAPRGLPDDAQYVSVLVCKPPPDGNIMNVLNGLYPTVFIWGQRTRSGSSSSENGSYALNTSGGASYPDPGDPAPAGAHLYAIVRPLFGGTGLAPAILPLDLVPRGMVPGSNGPPRGSYENGHWSEWQDPPPDAHWPFEYHYFNSIPAEIDYEYDAHGTILNWSQENYTGPVTWPNLEAKIADHLADFRTAGGLETGTAFETNRGLFAHAGGAFVASKSSGVDMSWETITDVAQGVATYKDRGYADRLDWFPESMSDLTWGDDYLDIPPGHEGPLTGDTVQYEGYAVRTGWADWHPRIRIGTTNLYAMLQDFQGDSGHGTPEDPLEPGSPGNPFLEYDSFTVGFRWAMFPYMTEFSPPLQLSQTPPGAGSQYLFPRFVVDPNWHAWGEGITAATYTSGPLPIGTSGDPDSWYPYVLDQITIPLSELGNVEAFTVVSQPDYLDVRDHPITDPAPLDIPGETWFHDVVASLFVETENLEWIGVYTGPDTGNQVGVNVPEVIYAQPRFRYWKPGPLPAYIPLGDLRLGDVSRDTIQFW